MSTTAPPDPPPACADCSKLLTAKELVHGQKSYDHEGRCCDCYDKTFKEPWEAL